MPLSTYAKQSFLNKTLTGTLNASFNGKAMRLNPTGVELGYTVKTSETPTLGGMVVQVFGVEMSDLIVSGTFGVGGWKEQETFLNEMVALAQAQGTHGTLDPSQGPVRFVYPQRNFDFQVYLKEYSSMGGLAIDFENTNIAPDWQLTLFIDTDNTGGALTKVAGDAYIARLAKGLGYQLNPFNGNLSTADIEAFLQSQGFPNDLKGYINAAFGSPVSTPSAPGSGGSTTPTTLTGSGNAQQAYNFFIGKGLSNFQACGIMGNLQQESSINPGSLQSGGPGTGIAQWSNPGRWQGVQALAAQENKPATDLGVQLDFLWQELTQSYGGTYNALKATTNVVDATTVFEQGYEGAGIPAMSQRISYAQGFMKQYGGG